MVGLDDGPPLLPQAASRRPSETVTAGNTRVRTAGSVLTPVASDLSGSGARSAGGSVAAVRRSSVFALTTVLATAGALGITVAPAAAHICPVAVEIPVGRPATIDVGVTVETATVPDVEIGIPTGLTLDRIDPKPGWTTSRAGSTVRYRGGPIAPYGCEYFSLGVTATVAGAYGISVVQRTADGTVVARSIPDPNNAGDRVLDQFVYAGVKPPASPSSSNGPSVTTIVGGALVGLGVVVFAVIAIRARRAGRLIDDDDDDADDDDNERDEPGGHAARPGNAARPVQEATAGPSGPEVIGPVSGR